MDATHQEMMPLSYKMMQNTKIRTKALKKVNTGMLKIQSFRWDGSRNIELATHNSKMYILKPLHKNVIYWYHT